MLVITNSIISLISPQDEHQPQHDTNQEQYQQG